MKKPTLVFIVLGTGCTLLAAEYPPPQKPAREEKPAREWTTEERLAARYDRENMRVRRMQADGDQQAKNTAEDVIEGWRNPELFLPFELFDNLITGAFLTKEKTRAQIRIYFEEHAESSGIGIHDIWTTLETVAAPYLEVRRHADEIIDSAKGKSELERNQINTRLRSVQGPRCALQAEALEAARAAFSPAKFDRFLYEVVAPQAFMSWNAGPEQLRFIERGCK